MLVCCSSQRWFCCSSQVQLADTLRQAVFAYILSVVVGRRAASCMHRVTLWFLASPWCESVLEDTSFKRIWPHSCWASTMVSGARSIVVGFTVHGSMCFGPLTGVTQKSCQPSLLFFSPAPEQLRITMVVGGCCVYNSFLFVRYVSIPSNTRTRAGWTLVLAK